MPKLIRLFGITLTVIASFSASHGDESRNPSGTTRVARDFLDPVGFNEGTKPEDVVNEGTKKILDRWEKAKRRDQILQGYSTAQAAADLFMISSAGIKKAEIEEPIFPPDPAFTGDKFTSRLKSLSSSREIGVEYYSRFSRARSSQHFDWIHQRISDEIAARERLNAYYAAGFKTPN